MWQSRGWEKTADMVDEQSRVGDSLKFLDRDHGGRCKETKCELKNMCTGTEKKNNREEQRDIRIAGSSASGPPYK